MLDDKAKQYKKDYYQKNKEKWKKYYVDNKDYWNNSDVKERRKKYAKTYNPKYYQDNKEKHNMQTKEWVKQNHERRLEILKKSRDKCKAKAKEYYNSIKNTPEYKERMRQTHARFNEKNSNYHRDWGRANPEKKLSYDIKRLEKLLPYYPHLKDSWDMAYALSNWANAVKKRDNHTCQNCGAKHRIHAHHILYPKTSYPTLVLDISNGVSFCRDCHEAYHQIFDTNT